MPQPGDPSAPGAVLAPLPRGDRLEKFHPAFGRWLGWATIVAAFGLLVVVVGDGLGSDDFFLVAALVAVVTLVYMVMVRPRVTAYQNVLLVKNLATDTDVPWSRIEEVFQRQTLVVRTDEGRLTCVASPRSAGRVLRSAPPTQSEGSKPRTDITYQEYVVVKVNQYAAERGAGLPVGAPIVRRWAWPELGLLAVSLAVAAVTLLT